MDLLNQIGIDTRHGLRLVELYRGDLTKLPHVADVLIISAALDGRPYAPMRGTMIGALKERFELDVGELASDPAIDLRPGLGTWLSQPVSGLPYKRIACVETEPWADDVGGLLADAFVALTVLEAKGIQIETVALPVLGAGAQGHPAHEVARALLDAVEPYLHRSLSVQRVQFVEIDTERADILNLALNDALGRPMAGLQNDAFVRYLRDDICSHLPALMSTGDTELVRDLERVLRAPPYEAYELGVHGRRLVECLVAKLASAPLSSNLYQNIEKLGEANVAKWIRGYMHVLRHIGNETVHYRPREDRIERPPFVEPADVAVALACIQRLLVFWSEHSNSDADSGAMRSQL